MKKLHPALENVVQQKYVLPSDLNVAVADFREYNAKKLAKITLKQSSEELSVEERVLNLSHGDYGIRLYRPKSVQEPAPTLVFIHGGGFVIGDLDVLHNFCCETALKTNCLLISIDYPKSPGFQFPVPVNVCYEATCWIFDHLPALGGDTEFFSIGGSSAGATLSAAVALMSRDKNGPVFHSQVLLCPGTDTNFSTPSYIEHADDSNLSSDLCKWLFSQYAPKDVREFAHPYFMPMHAEHLSGLPQALVVTAEYDPLRDDGVLYARRLEKEGVKVAHLHFEEMVHGFYSLEMDDLQPYKDEVFAAIAKETRGNE